jgi:hypothetical protein
MVNQVLNGNNFSLEGAIASAKHAADFHGLPQTVYQNADSCGWWHTNPFAKLLAHSELNQSILPTRYFF